MDVGGTGVKLRVSSSEDVHRFRSGKDLTPDVLLEKVRSKTATWHYDVVSIGYPGAVAGGKPVAEPKFDFPYDSTAEFLELAQTFEDTGVSAYNGAGPMIESPEVLASAGAIVQVEARHAAAIRLQNGVPVIDGGFDKSLEMQEVLDAVKPFVKS